MACHHGGHTAVAAGQSFPGSGLPAGGVVAQWRPHATVAGMPPCFVNGAIVNRRIDDEDVPSGGSNSLVRKQQTSHVGADRPSPPPACRRTCPRLVQRGFLGRYQRAQHLTGSGQLAMAPIEVDLGGPWKSPSRSFQPGSDHTLLIARAEDPLAPVYGWTCSDQLMRP